jgi:glycosyltransferase involved in cell wall biosynthesis
LKIAHLTSVHGAFDTRIFHKQCKSLARAGYDTYLVVVHDKDERIDGVQIKAIGRAKGRVARMVGTVWRVYQIALRLNADVYHLHDPELIPVGLALKRRNKIVVFDSHEDYPADILSKPWIPKGIRTYVSNAFARLEKYAFPKFDAVITVHQQIAERLKKIQPNTVVVHNFPIIDDSFIIIEDRLPKFVWLGMLSPIRGSMQIDSALNLSARAAMDVIGPVSNFITNNKKIVFLGKFLQPAAMAMASQYLAGLVTYLPEPNHVDALPNKLFEYMALGLPVIASDFPKWRKIIEDAGCGILVDPNSPVEIAKAMQWMLDNKAEAVEMGFRGRQAVLKKYSWPSEENTLLKLYEGFQI